MIESEWRRIHLVPKRGLDICRVSLFRVPTSRDLAAWTFEVFQGVTVGCWVRRRLPSVKMNRDGHLDIFGHARRWISWYIEFLLAVAGSWAVLFPPAGLGKIECFNGAYHLFRNQSWCSDSWFRIFILICPYHLPNFQITCKHMHFIWFNILLH